jgi:fructose-bisphosphate aldolase class II
MSLVTSKAMFQKAYKGGYAIGAFNIHQMETLQGIMEAAEEARAPIIIQTCSGARAYAKPIYLAKIVEAALGSTKIPVCVHLDHGEDFDICKSCIDSGFTSVMIDGSDRPFEENVEITKQVVDYAHDRGVAVEGELGQLNGIEGNPHQLGKGAFTDPDQAREFVERTGVDSLAVAIGTSHGAFKFKKEPDLQFDILKEIEKQLPGFPIVLHGASQVNTEYVKAINSYGGQIVGAQGVPGELVRKAASMAVCKVNFDSDLRLAFTAAVLKYLVEYPDNFDPRKYLGSAREAIKETVRHKLIHVLGCNGQA